MKTISTTYKSSFRERGSKFLGFLFPAETEEHFQKQLDQLKSNFSDATHHCLAWRLDPAKPKEFSSDDGEPSGTAGLPILNQLKSFDVVNAGIVVVRYYGGTKLGKSGLIEAYGSTAQKCLEKADLMFIQPAWLFEIRYPYPEEYTIRKLINDYELIVQASEYLENVKLHIACPSKNSKHFEKELSGMEHLNITFEKLEKSFI